MTTQTCSPFKVFFQYLKDNNIRHEFKVYRDTGSETIIRREDMTHELRTVVINNGLNIFELDTIIVVF